MENKLLYMDALDGLKLIQSETVDTCVTSPPYYGLRDYGVNGQIGLEQCPEEYVEKLVRVFHELRRVLKPDGTLWIVIGDSYAGSGKGAAYYPANAQKYLQGTNKGMLGAEKITQVPKKYNDIKPKDLIGIPWMLAFALRADGWYLRQDIIWAKPNPMPESVRDRCTKSHEYIFLLSKNRKYYFNAEAIAEPVAGSTIKRLAQNVENQNGSYRMVAKTNGPMKACAQRYGGEKYTRDTDTFYRTKSGNLYVPTGYRNKRDVWTCSTKPFKEAHFATYPDTLITPCVLATSREGGYVIDPFCGSGTTIMVANRYGRNGIGIEINKNYKHIIEKRLNNSTGENHNEEIRI